MTATLDLTRAGVDAALCAGRLFLVAFPMTWSGASTRTMRSWHCIWSRVMECCFLFSTIHRSVFSPGMPNMRRNAELRFY